MRCLVPQKRNIVLQSAAGDTLQVCLHIIPSHFHQLRIAEAHQTLQSRCPMLLCQGLQHIIAKRSREGVHYAHRKLPGCMNLQTPRVGLYAMQLLTSMQLAQTILQHVLQICHGPTPKLQATPNWRYVWYVSSTSAFIWSVWIFVLCKSPMHLERASNAVPRASRKWPSFVKNSCLTVNKSAICPGL